MFRMAFKQPAKVHERYTGLTIAHLVKSQQDAFKTPAAVIKRLC